MQDEVSIFEVFVAGGRLQQTPKKNFKKGEEEPGANCQPEK